MNQSHIQWQRILQWVLRILMIAVFGFAAFRKLTSDPEMVRQFGMIGVGQWFRYFVALVEIVGVVALLTPKAVRYGALLLLAVDAGAFVSQIAILHGDFIHTIVIGLLLGAIVWLNRGSATATR